MGALLRDVSSGVEWRLERGDAWVVGRGAACDVVLADTTVEPRHLRVEFVSGGWRVAALFAAAPGAIAVNGIPVEREDLRDGDILRVGGCRLAFTLDGTPPATDPGKPASRREAIPLPQSFDALLTVFTAPCPSVDSALVAARAGEALLRFCEITERRPALRRAFRDGLSSPWPVLRAVSAHGVAASAAGSSEAGEALAPLVAHPDETVRGAATRALASVDPIAAAPRVHGRALAALESAAVAEAAECAAQLAEIGDETLLADLARRAEAAACESGNATTRAAAAGILGELAARPAGGTGVRPLRPLLGDASEGVRLAAVAALRRACAGGEESPATAEARDALRGAIGDRSPKVFQAVARALAGTHDPLLSSLLVKALRASDPADLESKARYRRALEDVTGERRGPDPDDWI